MQHEEIDVALEELETRLERLRALYEQYFLGIEKIEPTVARKDVDRRFWQLRRTQIRNTAKRFKLQTLVQRYNTFQQYWTRICREIEGGTYTRHLLKAQKRFGAEPKTWAQKKRLGLLRKDQPSTAPEATPAELTRQQTENDISSLLDAALDPDEEARRALASLELPQSRAATPPKRGGSGELRLDLDEFGVPSSRRGSAARAAADAAPRTPGQPRPPARPPPPPRPRVNQPPPATASADHAATGDRTAARSPDPPRMGAPAAARSQPQPMPPQAPRMRPPLPRNRPPNAPSPQAPTGQHGAPKAASAPSDADRRPAPPVRAIPRPQPAGAAKPAPTVVRAAPPAPASTTPNGATPKRSVITDERVRELHSELIAAKQRLNQRANVSVDSLAKSLRDTAVKLSETKGGRVDFRVVVKNGQAIVKPVLRK